MRNPFENTEETVSISVREYEHLVERDKILSALEDAGVDNWDGYDDAIEEYMEENG